MWCGLAYTVSTREHFNQSIKSVGLFWVQKSLGYDYCYDYCLNNNLIMIYNYYWFGKIGRNVMFDAVHNKWHKHTRHNVVLDTCSEIQSLPNWFSDARCVLIQFIENKVVSVSINGSNVTKMIFKGKLPHCDKIEYGRKLVCYVYSLWKPSNIFIKIKCNLPLHEKYANVRWNEMHFQVKSLNRTRSSDTAFVAGTKILHRIWRMCKHLHNIVAVPLYDTMKWTHNSLW